VSNLATAIEPRLGPASAGLRPAPAGYPRRVPSAAGDRVRPSREVENREWLDALSVTGPGRDAAIARLHGLLLRAARHELGRRQAALSRVRGEELDDLATQAADDALVALLGKLGEFRGESRFTTWAYKFALLEAGVRLRRRAWQGREVVLEPDSWERLVDPAGAAQELLEDAEVIERLRQAVESALTPHQRRVFVALALNGVPIDVLAERMETTRGALYKALHDARRKLRGELAAAGLARPGAERGEEDEDDG